MYIFANYCEWVTLDSFEWLMCKDYHFPSCDIREHKSNKVWALYCPTFIQRSRAKKIGVYPKQPENSEMPRNKSSFFLAGSANNVIVLNKHSMVAISGLPANHGEEITRPPSLRLPWKTWGKTPSAASNVKSPSGPPEDIELVGHEGSRTWHLSNFTATLSLSHSNPT